MKQWLQSLTGFKKYALAFLMGGLMTLALPPVNLFPLVFLCVPAFIWLAQVEAKPGKSFLTGWAFGAGYLIFGFYWISAALFVDIGQWFWVMPLSLVAGPGLLALYYGFVPLLALPFRTRPPAHAVAIVMAWSVAEYARGHLMTGFPWNLPAYAFDIVLPLLQPAAIVGGYGLTLLTLFWASLAALDDRRVQAAALLTFVAALSYGSLRLLENPTVQNGDYTVRLVQPNIPQDMKWSEDQEWRNLQKSIDLTADAPHPTFVIWPETAVTADMVMFPEIARTIALGLPEGSLLITGSLRMTPKGGQEFDYFNSVTVMDKTTHLLATYDKHHLVPFGEYIPFRDKIRITPIARAVSGIGDFTPGTGAETLHVNNLPGFSPLICYEVLFPGEVTKPADRPDWLVNVTNDGWYGRSSGPYQHLAISRLRAIEEGLPLARAANTGISAMIDPVGRIIASHPLLEAGHVDAILPKPLPATVYARHGNKIFWLLLGLFLPFLLPLKRQEK